MKKTSKTKEGWEKDFDEKFCAYKDKIWIPELERKDGLIKTDILWTLKDIKDF